MIDQVDKAVDIQYRLELAFGKVYDDHCVHVPNLRSMLIRLTDEMVHTLLQLTVLHRAAVEYFGQVIYDRVNDEWTSLFFSIDVAKHSREEIEGERTYSVTNTVFQLTCGPRSLTTSSPPSLMPAAAKIAPSSSAFASPLSDSFCRSA